MMDDDGTNINDMSKKNPHTIATKKWKKRNNMKKAFKTENVKKKMKNKNKTR